MEMNTVEDMNKILAILDKVTEKRKTAYMALPRLSRPAEEHRRLAQDTDAYVELIEREKAITDRYFNVLQKREWAEAHKRWIQTGLDGYTVRELSPVGKELLSNFINNLEVPCE